MNSVRPVVAARRAIAPLRIGPDAEVAHVKDPLEPHAERPLEREDVLVHAVEGTMDIAGAQMVICRFLVRGTTPATFPGPSI